MRRIFTMLALGTALLWAANVKLYLKDGSYHIAREYKTEADRVRFYSVERGEWEEIPLELVDLKRTEAEIRARQASIQEEAAAIAAEDKAERAARQEVERVPQEPGVYLVEGDQLRTIKQAESKVVNNKRRSVLKVLSPIPMISGKATVELDGERSANVVASDRPEFYFRLVYEERFGIIKLTPQKNSRLVQKWTIVPVTNEIVEEQVNVDIFRQQVDAGLYKIWPTKPLEPGEYAVVEYTEGKSNVQVWDFSYPGGGGAKK
jgi:hypothetical protein